VNTETDGGPAADRRRSVHEVGGVRREDDYAWLQNLSDPEVIAHLEGERRHHDAAVAHLAGAREALLAEMTARTEAATESVPWRRGGVRYLTRTAEGAQYECLYRVDPATGAEELVLDRGALAPAPTGPADAPSPAGAPSVHVGLGCAEPSPDGRLLAYSVDVTGEELFELRFRDVATGTDLPDRLFPVLHGGAWSADGTLFFYTVPDDAYRPYLVARHRLGTEVAGDEVVHTETDRRFALGVHTTRDGEWVVIESTSLDTTEVRLVSAKYPTEEPRVVAPRREGVEYRLDVLPGGWSGTGPHRLLIVTNDRAPEFRLVEAAVPLPWTGVPGDPLEWGGVERALTSPDERLDGVAVFARHVVLTLRRDCEPFLRIVDRVPAAGSRGVREVHPGMPCGQLRLWHPDDPGADSVVVVEENLVTAPVWVRIELGTGVRKVLRRTTVPGVDPTRYQTERLTAVADDGTRVPVTIARHRDVLPGTSAGCVLHGYGALEVPAWPAFSVGTLSLLDRGVVVAVAHPRGGGELGRWWADAGRRRRKPNTFDDYVAARDRLEKAGWVGGGGVVTRGRSVGGGLLQAAVYGRAPDRWSGVVAEVPFVDVVTTLADPAAPRAAAEWSEWGAPHEDPQDLASMLAWSPYDNPPEEPGPPLLVTGALYDPRVLVHEPAKWVARLRARDGGSGPVLFRVETGPCPHTGPSGRHAALAYEAAVLAWVLERLGVVVR